MRAKITKLPAVKEKPPKYMVKRFEFTDLKSKNAYCKIMSSVAEGTVEIVSKHVTTLMQGNVVIWLEYWIHSPDTWVDDPDDR
jgi:hypothetical protein